MRRTLGRLTKEEKEEKQLIRGARRGGLRGVVISDLQEAARLLSMVGDLETDAQRAMELCERSSKKLYRLNVLLNEVANTIVFENLINVGIPALEKMLDYLVAEFRRMTEVMGEGGEIEWRVNKTEKERRHIYAVMKNIINVVSGLKDIGNRSGINIKTEINVDERENTLIIGTEELKGLLRGIIGERKEEAIMEK